MSEPQQTDMFKQPVSKMPEGYYSGGKPNPNLSAFVEVHLRERPYDATTDDYAVASFRECITASKATSVYNLHSYQSKKPHDAVRQYIRHYTKPDDLVLDPFCGSGGTALAAVMEGCKAIAIDRSPAATFITKNYCTPVDLDALQVAFEELKIKVKPVIDGLYETRCDRCGGRATTAYTVYSQMFQCPRCLEKVLLFDCVESQSVTAKGKKKKVSICPHCNKRGHEEVIRSQSQKLGTMPVLVSYHCEQGCKPARAERRHNDLHDKKREYFERYDLAKIQEIERGSIPYWYPQGYDMTRFSRYKRDALYYYQVNEVSDLFTKRNLLALATLKSAISADSPLQFVLSAVLLNASRMYRHRSGGGGGPKGTDFMIPQIGREMPVWPLFADKFSLAMRRRENHDPRILISTQSACDLSGIATNSVDYIFTDPPYGGTIQYGELGCVWEAWQGYSMDWRDEEITINGEPDKSELQWAKAIRLAMAECFRVLKPGRWLSLCYHDTSEGTWTLVQDIMADVGFEVDQLKAALFIDTGQKSYNQLTADKVNKRDLVINFRKPKQTNAVCVSRGDGVTSFGDVALDIIREHLAAHPGATKDRVYDAVVSRLVRQGKMEPHDFEALLRRVAQEARQPRKKDLFTDEEPDLFNEHEVSRWYLKETEIGAEESDRAVADSSAAKVEAHIIQFTDGELQKTESRCAELTVKAEHLRDELARPFADQERKKRAILRKKLDQVESEKLRLEIQRTEWSQHALHYSNISEYYFLLTPRPRCTLVELLEDYFFQTDAGNWRPPATDEERQEKAAGRGRAVRRTLQRFCRLLESGEAIPEEVRPDTTTLVEWIRYCKRSGLYVQGKMLYEQGGLGLDRLTEEVAANVEEDYRVCASRAAKPQTAVCGKRPKRG